MERRRFGGGNSQLQGMEKIGGLLPNKNT